MRPSALGLALSLMFSTITQASIADDNRSTLKRMHDEGMTLEDIFNQNNFKYHVYAINYKSELVTDEVMFGIVDSDEECLERINAVRDNMASNDMSESGVVTIHVDLSTNSIIFHDFSDGVADPVDDAASIEAFDIEYDVNQFCADSNVLISESDDEDDNLKSDFMYYVFHGLLFVEDMRDSASCLRSKEQFSLIYDGPIYCANSVSRILSY